MKNFKNHRTYQITMGFLLVIVSCLAICASYTLVIEPPSYLHFPNYGLSKFIVASGVMIGVFVCFLATMIKGILLIFKL